MMEQFEIIRSKRRTISIEIKNDMRVAVRAPLKMSDKDIQRFVMEKRQWIEVHLQIVKERIKEKEPPFTKEEIYTLTKAAMEDITQRIKKYAPIVGVTVGWIYRCAESACPVFWKSPVRKGEIIVPDR